MTPADAWPRAARSGMFAWVAVLLAEAAHSMGDGSVPSLGVAAACAAVVFLVGQASATTERSLAQLVAGMAAVQVVLHLVFTLTPGATAAGGMAPGGMAHESGPDTLQMLLAHGGAALLLAWVLRRGEDAVWGLSRSAARVVRAFLTLLSPPAWQPGSAALRVRARPPARRLSCRLLWPCVALRGPPALAG